MLSNPARFLVCTLLLFCSAKLTAGQGYLITPGQSLPAQVQEQAQWSRDYGSYLWLSGDREIANQLDQAGVRYSTLPGRDQIRVHDFRFDPVSPRFQASQGPRRIDGQGFGLVQFRGPVARADLGELRGAGLKPIQYYPHHTYLVWGQPDQLEQVRNVDSVRWSGDFSPEFRLHPRLAEFQGRIENLNVHFFNDGNPEAVLGKLADLGAEVLDAWPAQPDGRLWDAKITMDARDVASLAGVPQAISVNYMSPEPELEDESAAQTLAGNLDDDNVPMPGYADWLDETGVDGSGVIWAITDSGVYYDHVDLADRVVGGFSYPGCTNVPNPGDELSSGGGHGTHVAGITGGTGAAGYTDNMDLLYGLGMAPGMSFFAQNPICGTQNSWPPSGGWPVLSRDALEGGAIGSNNSWTSGEGTAHGYQNTERTYDLMVLDGNFESDVYEPFSVVFSSGNSGPGSSTLTSPKEAKNVLVTGGTQTHRVSGNVDAMYNSSSRGPAVDGRIQPDIAAPAQQVSSAIKPNATSCTATISGTGGVYSFCTGTSMAAPHASGALVILADWWREENEGEDFSPAMGKALLTNTARNDVDGGSSSVPNNDVGWGRVNTQPLLDSDLFFEFWDQEILLEDSGETWTTTVGVVDPSQPLRISLVWSDAAGAVGADPALVNDLDLEVETGGELYLGNVFDNGWSVTGGEPDRLNNLEHAFIEQAGGNAQITVRAHQIAGSVLVNDEDSEQAQHFSLVCQNCQREPDFILSVEPGHETVCAPDDGQYQIDIESIMGFDDEVSLWVEDLDPALDASLSEETVTPPGNSQLTVSGTGPVGNASFGFELFAESTTGIQSQELTLQVVEQEPDQVELLSPDDGVQDISLTPAFSWEALEDTDNYRFQLATDASFSDIVMDTMVEDTEFTPEDELDIGTDYYWRVQGMNFCGEGTWSETFSITTRLEPEASFSAETFSFSINSGLSDSDVLEISNAGTGNLTWSILTDSLDNSVRAGRFGGDFDIDNWELVNDPSGVGGSVEIEDGPPIEVFVTGGDSGTAGDTDFQIEIPLDGEITFDWGYQSTDSGCWDSGGYAINGVYTELACNSDSVPYFDETETVEVSQGDTFAFRVNTQDGNFGPGVLGVTNFEFAPDVCDETESVPWLSTDPEEGSVAESQTDSIAVNVNTAGLEPGDYLGYLCVTTNDPATLLTPMPVELEVTDPPDAPVIDVDPEEVTRQVPAGETDTTDLVVSNLGGQALEWSLDIADPAGCDNPTEIPWLSAGPESGTTDPGDSMEIEIGLDAEGLAKDSFQGLICIESNDESQPLVEVPVTMEVVPGEPILSSVSPDSAAAGSDDLPIEVSGENFQEDSVVRWNGEDLPTTHVADDELEAVIPASELEEPTEAQVTVWTPEPGGGDSNALTFEVTAAVAILEGTVSGLGYCGQDPAGIEGAVLEVSGPFDPYSAESGPDGNYYLELEEETAEVTVTIEASGHLDDSATDIFVRPGETTVVDFDLTLDAPCASLSPEALSTTLVAGDSGSLELELGNTSGAPTTNGQLEWTAGVSLDGCADPEPVDWLDLEAESGTVDGGQSTVIGMLLDTDGLEAGLVQASICLTTSDGENPEPEVPVEVEILSSDIFEDRFETGSD